MHTIREFVESSKPVKLHRRTIVRRAERRSRQTMGAEIAMTQGISGRPHRFSPYYETKFGAAYLGDSRVLISQLPKWSVDLILTSPPFALTRKKRYGNVGTRNYVRWFLPFAREFKRVLKPKGHLVIDIGGAWKPGRPVKSLYQFKLLIALCEEVGFHLAQDLYWFNPAKLPGPAEWVTVKRLRLKDAVDQIWWLVKNPFAKANNADVPREYSDAMKELLNDPNYYKPGRTRPSGQYISNKFFKRNNGAIAPNLLEFSNTESGGRYMKACKLFNLPVHPARFPAGIPDFFIKLLTKEEDLILDPFAGSNVTGATAESLRRHWLAFEILEDYVKGSMGRFFTDAVLAQKLGVEQPQNMLYPLRVAA